MKIITGRILSYIDNPFNVSSVDSVCVLNQGGILIENGFIKQVDKFNQLKIKYPNAEIFDYGKNLITKVEKWRVFTNFIMKMVS